MNAVNIIIINTFIINMIINNIINIYICIIIIVSLALLLAYTHRRRISTIISISK